MTTTQPWYANGLRFTCTQCGRCCGGAPGNVWVSDAEIAALAKLKQMPDADFRRLHTRTEHGRISLLEHDDGDCEFLVRDPATGKAGCSVYQARPLQCRTWPFWKSNVRSQRTWDLAARNCPGMNHGALHPLNVIQDAVRRAEAANLPL